MAKGDKPNGHNTKEKPMARCWYYDVSLLDDPGLFARGMESLPWDERKQAILRYRMQPDRLLGLGAGLLCAHALRHEGASDLTLAYGENQKPRLKYQPTPHIHFNLSHSGNIAICAVSNHAVGADVELMHEADAGIARICFTEQEIAWMNSQDDPGRAFTRLWTRKESYIKYLGTGFYTEPKSFCALPGAESTADVAYSEHEVSDHLMCVCAHADEQVEFVRWEGIS